MGIALLTFVDLLAPLQSLACKWMPKRNAAAADCSAGLRYVAVRPACTTRGALPASSNDGAAPVVPTPSTAQSSMRTLRVVRTVDAHRVGGRTGQVVLSGRMIDVCAELDRLAALEAAESSTACSGSRVLH